MQKRYLYSGISIMICSLWVVVILKLFIDHVTELSPLFIGITLVTSIYVLLLSAIIIVLLRFVKRPGLRHRFLYNFLATGNLFHSIAGLMLSHGQTPAPYFATSGFALGVLMYYDIYRNRSIS